MEQIDKNVQAVRLQHKVKQLASEFGINWVTDVVCAMYLAQFDLEPEGKLSKEEK